MKFALSRKNLWEKTPPFAKRMIGAVLGQVPPQYLLGGTFRANLQRVHAAEKWTASQARQHQISELRRVLSTAQNAPFYQELFARHNLDPTTFSRLEDLSRLPLMDRETVQSNLDRMTTTSVEASNIDYVTTGGTTGAPLRFYAPSSRHSVEYAYILAGWERTGYKLGDRMYVLRGRKVPIDSALGFHHEYEPLLRHHYYSNFDTSIADFDHYLDHMRKTGPGFLHAYPSSAFALARHIRAHQRKAPPIRAVLLESEIVYPEQRAMIEEVFGVRCFSGYGHTEKLVAAAECEHSPDYHVWPGYGYCELIKEDGSPAQLGEQGEIVGTGFMNTVVPFIRYRTGDLATLIAHRCDQCGREQMILRDIRGHRVQESLVLADGSLISWTAINMHDDTFDRVSRVQFMQEKPGEAVLRIVTESGYTQQDEQRMLTNLEAKLRSRLRITLERVTAIELSKSGKAIYVDQRIPGIARH